MVYLFISPIEFHLPSQYTSAFFSPPISDYDVFNEGKTQSFFESQPAVRILCTYLESINKEMEKLSENQLFEYFNKLLQVSIFYNTSVHDNQMSALHLSIRKGSGDDVHCALAV